MDNAEKKYVTLASPNRCISNFANAPSKFFALLGTSDMPRMLYEMAGKMLTIKKVNKP